MRRNIREQVSKLSYTCVFLSSPTQRDSPIFIRPIKRKSRVRNKLDKHVSFPRAKKRGGAFITHLYISPVLQPPLQSLFRVSPQSLPSLRVHPFYTTPPPFHLFPPASLFEISLWFTPRNPSSIFFYISLFPLPFPPVYYDLSFFFFCLIFLGVLSRCRFFRPLRLPSFLTSWLRANPRFRRGNTEEIEHRNEPIERSTQ